MFKPPFAAAATAILVMLAGGPFGVGEAHARAIYKGTFDPQDDDYKWSGTHTFEVSDACLSSNGWREANTGYGGYAFGYDGFLIGDSYNSEPCTASLIGGSLTVERLSSGFEAGPFTLNFSNSNGQLPVTEGVWGVFVKDGELAGVDTDIIGGYLFPAEQADLLGFDVFEGDFSDRLFLRWESGWAPDNFSDRSGLFEDYRGDYAYDRSLIDPVYAYVSCGLEECRPDELTPDQRADNVDFNRVPEPGSLALAGLAIAALAGLRRRAA